MTNHVTVILRTWAEEHIAHAEQERVRYQQGPQVHKDLLDAHRKAAEVLLREVGDGH